MDTFIRVCISVVCTQKQLPAVLQVMNDHRFELIEIELEYVDAANSAFTSIFAAFQQHIYGDDISVSEVKAELAAIEDN